MLGLAAAIAAGAASAATTVTVKRASNSKLGAIVVTATGKTLYHLTGESAAKFLQTRRLLQLEFLLPTEMSRMQRK